MPEHFLNTFGVNADQLGDDSLNEVTTTRTDVFQKNADPVEYFKWRSILQAIKTAIASHPDEF